MNLKRIIPPQSEPVSVEEVQEYLRTDESETVLQALILAAREHAENFTRRVFVTQMWDLMLDRFPGGSDPITVPLPPLQSVERITYRNEAGEELEMDPTTYIVFSQMEPGRILPVDVWPAGKHVTIRFVAGYGEPADVPQAIKQAIMLLVGHFHEVRADRLSTDSIVGVGSLQWGGQSVAEMLLWPYRDVRMPP